MTPHRILLARGLIAAAALLAGCGDRAPKPPDIAEVFPTLPLPPAARLVSRSGGADALLLTLRSPHSSKDVQAYYDAALTRNGWRMVSRAKASDGGTVLLAELAGQPLWVRIRPAEDTSATLVELGGAVVARSDSAKTAKPTS
jgi:hypothetical protein